MPVAQLADQQPQPGVVGPRRAVVWPSIWLPVVQFPPAGLQPRIPTPGGVQRPFGLDAVHGQPPGQHANTAVVLGGAYQVIQVALVVAYVGHDGHHRRADQDAGLRQPRHRLQATLHTRTAWFKDLLEIWVQVTDAE